MRNWCSARRRRTSPIRRSRRCSCAPSSCRRQGVLLANRRRRAPDEPEVWASHHAVVEGATIAGAGVRNRPHGDSSAVAANCARRSPCSEAAQLSGTVGHGARRGVRAALLACACRPAAPRASRSGPAWRRAGRRCSNSRTNIAIRTRTCAPRRWRGRRHRCSCGTSASTPRRPISSSSSPDASCTPTRPRVPRPTRFGAAPAARSRCGRRAFRAICPSCCMRIEETRRSARGAPAPAGARILGHQAAVGGPGDPQRTRRLVRAGPAGGARIDGARRAGPAAHRRRRHARQGVRAARAISSRRKRAARCSPWRAWCCRAGVAASPTRSNACSRRRSLPPRLPRRAPQPAPGPPGSEPKPRASWSSSTASAASRRRAASTPS